MIKLYFDTNPLIQGHAVRGVGTYVRNLLEELSKNKNIKLVTSENEADIIHYPYFDLFFNTLKVGEKPTVVTVFDTIPLIYPNNYPPGVKGKLNFLKQKRELKKATAIITISETSKKDIVRFLDIPSEKIFPIHLAANKKYKRIKSVKNINLPQRFVLYVGDVNYNKNILALIKAVKEIGVKLVIVGRQAYAVDFDKKHIENRDLLALSSQYNEDKDILRLGFVEDEELIKIYNLATVYCQPSFYEGFGVPVLEAQACGTPVVATKIQAHTEIAGESCLFVETDVKGLAKGLESVFNNKILQRELAARGFKNIKKFSWPKTAMETINVYKNLI